MRLKRWTLRDYYLPTGEVVSERQFVFRRSAESIRRWHSLLLRSDRDFDLRVEPRA